MNAFLPEGYKVPVNSDYMKFKDGENTFRVLGSAVIGYEYWNTANEPVRSKTPFIGTPADIRYEEDKKTGESKPQRPKHFWAFPVWNVEAERVQILQISQQGIMDAIKALVDNKKWGDPKGYDISVTRSGSGFDTEYQTMPNPHTAAPQKALEQYASRPINLEALFSGGNPFDAAPAVAAETATAEVSGPDRSLGELAPHEEPVIE